MNDVQCMLEVYKHDISNKIKKFSAPLEQHFGIDEFVYTYISNEGQYFAISNQPEASEFYFHQGLYKSNVLIRHPDNYFDGPLLPGYIPNKKHKNVMGERFGYYGNTELIIFKKTNKGVHKFLFNTKIHKNPLIGFYFKNLPFFQAFCKQFLKEWQSHHRIIEKYTINISRLIGPDFYQIIDLDKSNPIQELHSQDTFLKQIGCLQKDFKLFKPFSAQEKICLNLLSEGKTLKKVAEDMHLSYKTVEHYLENIKDKVNCTKSELLDQIPALKLMGIL